MSAVESLIDKVGEMSQRWLREIAPARRLAQILRIAGPTIDAAWRRTTRKGFKVCGTPHY